MADKKKSAEGAASGTEAADKAAAKKADKAAGKKADKAAAKQAAAAEAVVEPAPPKKPAKVKIPKLSKKNKARLPRRQKKARQKAADAK